VVAVLAWGARASADPFVAGTVTLRAAGEASAEGTSTRSLALDGWLDINERFRIGLTSSTDARELLGAGRGLCVSECRERYGGLALDTRVLLGPHLVGHAALDTTRFAPTTVALELGFDVHATAGPVTVLVGPTLRLGIARRDLQGAAGAGGAESGALYAQVAVRAWSSGGVFAAARLAIDLEDPSSTPSVGAAGGVFVEVLPVTISARFGAAELATSTAAGGASDHVFGELAVSWSR